MAESFVEIVDHHLKSSNVRLPVFSTTALRIQQELTKEDSDIRSIEKMIVTLQNNFRSKDPFLHVERGGTF
jgi:hypothetical protein